MKEIANLPRNKNALLGLHEVARARPGNRSEAARGVVERRARLACCSSSDGPEPARIPECQLHLSTD
jgi:hypothetical protein